MPKSPPTKVFRDAVHGDVEILAHELIVINTATFQRLHGIRQLDLAYKVFHDAVHTRFQHLVGATHVVDQIWARLTKRGTIKVWFHLFKPDYSSTSAKMRLRGAKALELPDDLEVMRHIVRLATLIHDVTHIPFGHMLENQARIFQPHDSGHRWRRFLRKLVTEIAERCTTDRQFVDENYSPRQVQYLLYLLTQVAPIMVELSGHADVSAEQRDRSDIFDTLASDELPLPSNMPDEFACTVAELDAVFHDGRGLPREQKFLADMIGNTICADLLDYLRRDNYFTGLWDRYDDRIFGAFDLAALGEDAEVHLSLQVMGKTIRQDTLSNILRILELRYDLAEKVVFHRARCAAGAMLIRAFKLSGIREADEPLFYDCTDDQALQLLVQRASVNAIAGQADADAVRSLVDGVLGRDFYKPYYRFGHHADAATAHGELNRTTVGGSLFTNPTDAEALLREIESQAKLPTGSVVLYCPDPRMMLKEALAVVSGEADGGIPRGELLRNWAKDHLPVRRRHIDAIEDRYSGLWSITFFVHPRYRANARILCTITEQLLRQRYGHAPAQDPMLERLLLRLPGSDEINQRLATMSDVSLTALGNVIRSPLAARGEPEVETEMLSRITDAVDQAKRTTARKGKTNTASTKMKETRQPALADQVVLPQLGADSDTEDATR